MSKNNGNIIKQTDAGYEDFVTFAKDLDSSVICKSGCKLCYSPHRAEAEEEFERTGNVRRVQRLLDSKGEKLAWDSVKRHLTRHFTKPGLHARMKEYAEDLEHYGQIRQDKRDRLEEHITILERRIRLLDSCSDGENLDTIRKN